LGIAGCLLGTALPALADAGKPAGAISDDWSMTISPYVWGAGLEGSIASFPHAPEADVDVGFKDILKHLDMGGMVIAQLRHRRFAGYVDLIYTSISAEQGTPLGILFDRAELGSEVFVGTFGGAYRPLETEHASLDLLAGLRVWSVDTDLELTGGALPDQDLEHSENWIDPVVGFSARYEFDNGPYLVNLFQIGGFGVASDLTWDAFGGIGYQFSDTVSATAGYRHLEVDYQNNGFVFDVELSGPVIGMTVRF
jgi:hypothetical protein